MWQASVVAVTSGRMLDLAMGLRGSLEPREVVQRTLDAALELLEADRATLSTLTPERGPHRGHRRPRRQPELVAVGERVARGEPVGLLGSTGPHCHFEVRMGDRPVDPAPLTR
jgi:murein DD-endopeptidase MepM/ murein hydrolase activator NlpD